MSSQLNRLLLLLPAWTALISGSACNAESLLLKDQRIIRVPLTRQATDYTCGAAALQSVLGYYGENFREGVLAKELRSNNTYGTSYKRIASFAQKHGYTVKIIRDAQLEQLKSLLDAQQPSIVLIQAWPEKEVNYAADWDDGHYVVAVGYDDKNVYFMDPCTIGNYTFIPVSEFMDRWHDRTTGEKLEHFIMTVSKPKAAFNPLEIKKME
jgi:predicted double-glycine peptidase